MNYADQKFADDNRRFSRMRNLTFGQCMTIVGGACVLIFGAYFLFSVPLGPTAPLSGNMLSPRLSPVTSFENEPQATPSFPCSGSWAALPHRLMQCFIPVPGSTLHLGGVGKNRIGKQPTSPATAQQASPPPAQASSKQQSHPHPTQLVRD